MAYPGFHASRWITPVTSQQVQPAGIDLRVSKIFMFNGKGYLGVDSKQLAETTELEPNENRWILEKGAYKIRFAEIVSVPEEAVGFCYPRSSLLRMGASLLCAVWDPGYKGRGESLLIVENPHGIEIEVGARIAQLVFIRLVEKPQKTYDGSYQGENIAD